MKERATLAVILLGSATLALVGAATTVTPSTPPPTTTLPPINCQNESQVIEDSLECFAKPLEDLVGDAMLSFSLSDTHSGRRLLSVDGQQLRPAEALLQQIKTMKTLHHNMLADTASKALGKALKKDKKLDLLYKLQDQMGKTAHHLPKVDPSALLKQLLRDVMEALAPLKYLVKTRKTPQPQNEITDLINIAQCIEAYGDAIEDSLEWLKCIYRCEMMPTIVKCMKSHYTRCGTDMVSLGDYVFRGFLEYLGFDKQCFFNVVYPNETVSNEVRLTEGGPPAHVMFNMHLPPSILCISMSDVSADGLIFGLIGWIMGEEESCSINVHFSLSNFVDEILPEIPLIGMDREKCANDAVTAQVVVGSYPGSGRDLCHLPITEQNWETVHSVPVHAAVNFRNKNDYSKHQFTMKLVVNEETQTSVKRNITIGRQITNQDAPVTCRSINDPHISTFDEKYYNNHYEGYFQLYRHSELPYEVQVIYQRCEPGMNATCTCAVAARSGDDVMVVDRCRRRGMPRSGEMRAIVYINKNLTPGTRIFRKADGLRYEMLTPHGQYIRIQNSGPSLNVWIEGSLYDFEKTRGLCGILNRNPNDDLTMRNGSIYNKTGDQPREFSQSWRVPSNERIFQGAPASTFSTDHYCTCHHSLLDGTISSCGHDKLVETCDLETDGEITRNLSVVARSTTNRHEAVSLAGDDVMPQAGTGNIDIDESWEPPNHQWGSWNEARARSSCENFIENLPGGRTCADEFNLDTPRITNEMQGCIDDIRITDGTEWRISAYDAVIERCLEGLRRKAESETYENVRKASCIANCNNNGTCQNGTCVCNQGLTGGDCSQLVSAAPYVTSIASGGLCDIRYDDCSRAILFGGNFRDGMKCVVKEATIDANGIRLTSDPERTVDMMAVSPGQAVCALPRNGTYYVRVAEDPTRCEKIHVTHDAACFACDVHRHRCRQRPAGTYCMINDVCYADNQTNPSNQCQYCNITTGGQWTWRTDQQCDRNRRDQEQRDRQRNLQRTLRIVFAVLLTLLVIAIAGTLFIITRRKSKIMEISEAKAAAAAEKTPPTKQNDLHVYEDLTPDGATKLKQLDGSTGTTEKKPEVTSLYPGQDNKMDVLADEAGSVPKSPTGGTQHEQGGPHEVPEVLRLKAQLAAKGNRERTSSTGSYGLGGGGPAHLSQYNRKELDPEGTNKNQNVGIGGHFTHL